MFTSFLWFHRELMHAGVRRIVAAWMERVAEGAFVEDVRINERTPLYPAPTPSPIDDDLVRRWRNRGYVFGLVTN